MLTCHVSKALLQADSLEQKALMRIDLHPVHGCHHRPLWSPGPRSAEKFAVPGRCEQIAPVLDRYRLFVANMDHPCWANQLRKHCTGNLNMAFERSFCKAEM